MLLSSASLFYNAGYRSEVIGQRNIGGLLCFAKKTEEFKTTAVQA
tara:strand:+ start:33020 stop:33154 length:135 start_codon:yes stop_codon:yes gene_type:complete